MQFIDNAEGIRNATLTFTPTNEVYVVIGNNSEKKVLYWDTEGTPIFCDLSEYLQKKEDGSLQVYQQDAVSKFTIQDDVNPRGYGITPDGNYYIANGNEVIVYGVKPDGEANTDKPKRKYTLPT